MGFLHKNQRFIHELLCSSLYKSFYFIRLIHFKRLNVPIDKIVNTFEKAKVEVFWVKRDNSLLGKFLYS